jgi:hypothetical protein
MPNFKIFNEVAILARGPDGTLRTDEQTGAFTDQVIWTPAAGKRVRLYGGIVSTSLVSTVTLHFGTGGGATTIAVIRLGATSSFAFTFPTPIEGAINEVVAWSGGVLLNTANVTLFGEEV